MIYDGSLEDIPQNSTSYYYFGPIMSPFKRGTLVYWWTSSGEPTSVDVDG